MTGERRGCARNGGDVSSGRLYPDPLTICSVSLRDVCVCVLVVSVSCSRATFRDPSEKEASESSGCDFGQEGFIETELEGE